MLTPRPPQVQAAHLQKKAVVYIRQSSPEQVRDHVGSTAAQFELRDLARAWGWPASRIVPIDTDLGISATSATKRTGFQALLELIERGEISIVFVRELSRLARNFLDSARFVEAARKAALLIYANGRVYNAASESDSDAFALMLEGLLAVRENAARVRMFATARAAKARAGYAVSTPPIGYIPAPRGKWVKDSDPRVRDAVQQVFELYPRLGSLNNVIKYFRSNGLGFPRRVRGEVRPGPLNAAQLDCILRNPAYTGDYVYQRYRATPATESEPRRLERRPRADWITVPNHHDPYVTREAWERIQELLAEQRPHMRPLAGKGNALLQGRLRCGLCDRWIHTRYWGRDGQARTATYVCRRTDGAGNTTHRVALPARLFDQAIAREMFAALTPVEIRTAVEVVQAEHKQQTAAERMRRHQLQRADDAVEDANQAYLQADRANQLVKADLEARYEAALKSRDRLQAEFAATASPDKALTPEDGVNLVQLTSNVEGLWSASTTTHEDRKLILRTLISEIIVQDATKEAADLEIVWVGGLRQVIRVLLPRGVDAFVRDQATSGKGTRTITDELNAAGAVTASGRPMSMNVVSQKLGHLGLRLKPARLRARDIIHHGLLAGLPRPEILRRLQEQTPRLGPWDPQRLSDEIRRLKKGASGLEPLPVRLPAELEKDQVLEIIESGIGAGERWKTIAGKLNDSGLRPPRARSFTPVQVRLLFMRSLGLRSLRLPRPASGSASESAVTSAHSGQADEHGLVGAPDLGT